MILVLNKVFYDHNCRFCKKIKNILSNLDILNYFKWLPGSEYNFDENKYNITQKTLDTSIVLIDASNTVYIEFYACRYIMLYIPFFWPIILFLYIPIISPFLGNAIYRRISKSRDCI